MFCNMNLHNQQIVCNAALVFHVIRLRCKLGTKFKFVSMRTNNTMHQNNVHEIDIDYANTVDANLKTICQIKT